MPDGWMVSQLIKTITLLGDKLIKVVLRLSKLEVVTEII